VTAKGKKANEWIFKLKKNNIKLTWGEKGQGKAPKVRNKTGEAMKQKQPRCYPYT